MANLNVCYSTLLLFYVKNIPFGWMDELVGAHMQKGGGHDGDTEREAENG